MKYIITGDDLETITGGRLIYKKLAEKIRSHPYNPQADQKIYATNEQLGRIMDAAETRQAAREKVLDELIEWRDKQKTGKCSEMSDWFDIWCDEGEFIQKLRQEGKRDEV